MYKVSIISLFFICAVTVSSACKVDCRTVRCAAPICDPGYESFKPPCECCNKCRKIKGPPCKVDCSTVDCAYVECDPGYESYTPPCECCNKCRKIKNPSCNVDCRTVLCAAVECAPGYESYTPPCECCNKCRKIKGPPCEVDCTEPCPLIKCAPGYTSVKPPCKCCNECKKIETPPGSEVCETIDCNGNECPIVDCIEGYKPVRSECGCCDKCVPIKTNPGSEVCESIDCNGRPCPIVDCIAGYVPVRSECGCCDKCVPVKEECNVNCSEKHCPQIRCRTGYKLVKPKCGCCEECQKIKDTCGKDEVYNYCGSACPETCANLGKNQVCTLQCVEGCFCKEGLVRNDSGKCVHPNQCPKNTCGKDEVFNDCGSACPETCANLGKNQVCTLQCVEGCFCKEGLVRNDSGKCVHPNQCPKKECNVNCSEKHCPQIRCRTGYKLVKPKCGCCEECQKIKDTCGKDEVYNDCGSACPETCANLGKNQVCTLQCVEGCFCKEGLVRNDSGKCVNPNQCPKNTCGKDEVYNDCGSACPKTCANLGKDQVCTKQCVEGCFCQEGLVRNDSGKCVHPNQCPKNTCGKNEVYSECGSTCPKTCANLGKNQVCSFLCVKGCFCRDGMVRNDKGECIQPSQCPKRSCKNTKEDSSSDSESDEEY